MGRKKKPRIPIKQPTVQALVEYVCRELGAQPAHIFNRRYKEKSVSASRQLVWYVMFSLKLATYGRLAILFNRHHTTIMRGVKGMRRRVTKPEIELKKDPYDTFSRRKQFACVYEKAKAVAVVATARADAVASAVAAAAVTAAQVPAVLVFREMLRIPICRLDLSELDNLAMADVAIRFSGGWLVDMKEFERNLLKYPVLIQLALVPEKEEDKFIWVIPTSYANQDAVTIDAPSKAATGPSLPSTTAATPEAPTTSLETPTQPTDTRVSSLQTQRA